MFRKKSYRENQNKHSAFINSLSPPPPPRKSCSVGKNMVESDRPQTTIKDGACVLHAEKLRLQARTQNMQYLFLFHCNNGSTNALNNTSHVHCLSCYRQRSDGPKGLKYVAYCYTINIWLCWVVVRKLIHLYSRLLFMRM